MESEQIKQWNSCPKSQLQIFGILKESFKTTNRNRKLLFPVLVLVFLSFSLLDFAQTYLLEPVAQDLSLQLSKNPTLFQDFGHNMHQTTYSGALNDIRDLLLVKLITLALSLIISLVFLVATVSSTSEAYTAKVFSLKDLFLKTRKSWKTPIITSFYMILISFGIVGAYFFSIGIISVMAVDSSAYLLYGVVSLSILILYFYVTALWIVSLVISILDGFSGIKAIARADELMKGKRVQASLVMVVFSVSCVLVHLMASALSSYDLNKSSLLAVKIPFTNGLICALKLFVFVVFTVFYHERKKICDENEATELYVSLVADEV